MLQDSMCHPGHWQADRDSDSTKLYMEPYSMKLLTPPGQQERGIELVAVGNKVLSP